MKKENTKFNIDIMRLIASILVIAIHTYPLTIISESLDYAFTRVIFRIAVPLFLLITGYFILPAALEDKNKLIDYTKKILKMYLISMLIYLPINIYNHYFTDFTIIKFLKDVFLNGTFYHLWYFPALILGTWLVYLLIKTGKNKLVVTIVFLLYLIGLFGDSYYGLIANTAVNKFYDIIFNIFTYTRNGLFYVPIFLYMGYSFKSIKDKINIKTNITLIIVFTCLMLIEGMLLYSFNIPRHNSMYLFLIPLSYFIFNFGIYYSNGSNKKIRNIASWIYILHPLFIIIIRLLAKILHLDILIDNSLIMFILVALSTVTFATILETIKNNLQKRRI